MNIHAQENNLQGFNLMAVIILEIQVKLNQRNGQF